MGLFDSGKSKGAARSGAARRSPIEKGAGMAHSWWVAGLVAVALVLTAAYGLGLWNVERARQASENQARLEAEGLARRLAKALTVLKSDALALVSDERLVAAMQQESVADLRGLERSLASGLPRGTRLRLFLRGSAQSETSSDDPYIGFASLDSIRTAEALGQATLFEIHGLNTEHAHLAGAVPVLGSSGVLGVAHLAVPNDTLQLLVEGSGSPTTRVVVQQVTGAARTDLMGSGDAAVSGAPSGTIPVAGAPWQVAYWSVGPIDAGESLGAIWIWSGAAALAGLFCLVLWGAAYRQIAVLRRDLDALTPRLRPAFSERRVDTGCVQLREMRQWVSEWGSCAPSGGTGKEVRDQASATDVSLPAPAEDPAGAAALAPVQPPPAASAPSVFRAYDVRGIVERELTSELMFKLGQAVGSEALERGRQAVLLGRDGRNSSPGLAKALADGLLASGRDVVDLGEVPTPVFYFATHFLGSDTGVMITGSHNPPDYNGAKIVMAGETLYGDAIQSLARRIEQSSFSSGEGRLRQQDLVPDYSRRIVDDVNLARPLKIVIDCGNGVAGSVAPSVFRELGCEVVELYCEVDGHFPNHHPDPSRPENLQALARNVTFQGADLGLGFDGDGDRLGVVDSSGKIIWPDRVLMLLANDVLTRHPGADIVYDVKSSRLLGSSIRQHGGRPLMVRTGHSFLKAKIREVSAPLGGELSGHIVFAERWYGFDDAIYAGARLVELLSADPRASAEIFAELPEAHSTPELQLTMAEGEPVAIVSDLGAAIEFQDAELTRIDGIRAEYPDGWGLVRASNTTPALVFRFEADSAASLHRIQGAFRSALLRVRPGLTLPY